MLSLYTNIYQYVHFRYQCECWAGAESAEVDDNPTCIDIDECALEYCKGGTCVNKPGGFDCRYQTPLISSKVRLN